VKAYFPKDLLMADVSFFPGFTYKWAQTGQSVTMDDTQYKLGWAYIGATHPSVEQFNKVFQIADEKSNYLYRQIRNAVTSRGLTLSAHNDDSLRDAINMLLPVGVPLPWPTAVAPSGFILMNGQAINAAQYPTLATLYGSNLPDLRERFIRGASGSIAPLTMQNDAIKAHSHAATTNNAGQHGHTYTMGGSGNHTHNGTTSAAGSHQHNMRSDNIGAGGGFDSPDFKPTGDSGPIQGVSGTAGNHSHGFTTGGAGDHTHHLSINANGGHTHEITVGETGSTETRPKAIAFYYICRAG
jgi:hypothetical protein